MFYIPYKLDQNNCHILHHCNLYLIIMTPLSSPVVVVSSPFSFQTFDGSDVADLLINLLPTVRNHHNRETKGLNSLTNPLKTPDENATEDLQMFMATGRVKDGLDHAIQTGLWGHAFMMASLMGPKYLGAVQTKYA